MDVFEFITAIHKVPSIDYYISSLVLLTILNNFIWGAEVFRQPENTTLGKTATENCVRLNKMSGL